MCLASIRGLVVQAEDIRGCGFKPPIEETIFQKRGAMECSYLPGIVACAVILLTVGRTLRTTVRLLKSSSITNGK
jgi:hypothetical protein